MVSFRRETYPKLLLSWLILTSMIVVSDQQPLGEYIEAGRFIITTVYFAFTILVYFDTMGWFRDTYFEDGDEEIYVHDLEGQCCGETKDCAAEKH